MITELRLRNFKNFDRKDISLVPGLNFIHGVNGTGKSTIIEAIPFAMFGPRALKSSREDTVRWGAVGDASAELTGELFADEFTVKRFLSGKVELKISDGTKTKRAKDVAKYFGGIFIDLKTFTGTCVSYQKDVDRLASQEPAERRDFISKVLCLDVIKDCIDSLGKEISALKSVDLSYMQSLMNDLSKVKAEVKNLDLNKVTTAFNMMQELKRIGNRDPVAARIQLEAIQEELAKTEKQKVEWGTLEALYSAALKTQYSTCPICRSEIDVDNRKELEQLLVHSAHMYTAMNDKITAFRLKMIDAQEIASLNDPKVVQQNLAQTGIKDPEKAFESLRQYETLKAQLTTLQKDLPDHKKKVRKEELRQMFRDFREYVLVPYFGVINFVMTEYLTTNTKFNKFTLHDDYNVTVDDKPLTAYSGGQIDLICTLFRLAAARVLAELRYGKLPFMLFDSFADALDDDNFSLVMQFLQTQLPNVDQCVITAHHSVSVPGAYRITL